jgi:cytochrome c553
MPRFFRHRTEINMSPNRSQVFHSHVAGFMLAMSCCFSLPAVAMEQEGSAAGAADLESGRRIYVEGVLPSGAALTGTRFDSSVVSGAQAACISCHRRSGMGQVEGDLQVPPITGNFLFAPKTEKHLAMMDPRVSKSLNQSHDPYTQASLAEAIIHGRNNRGREMSVAMPRYNLSEADMNALTVYLKQLSAQWSPGVTQNSIRFATVITPDVDPLRRKTMIDMMQMIFRQKNGSTENAARGHSRRHMTSAAEFVLGTERTWDLDVWELQGAPETWGEQLAAHYRSQPVFALISGISASTWQPVHEFCEQQNVPCWFPSVDLPVKAASQYSFYFSGGVMLEADVLARHLLGGETLPKRVIQIFRDETVGRAASQELEHAFSGSPVTVENRILGADSAGSDALRTVLGKQRSGDVVVYWLRQDDVALLGRLRPVRGVANYFSSRLANAEHAALPAAWRSNSHLVYLYELPAKRENNLAYFRAWINMHKFPLVDEAMQSEVFFALNYMTDTSAEMLNNLYRDYLVERAETMMDKREGSKAEQETRDRLYLGQPGDLARKHGEMRAKEEVRLSITGQVDTAISHGTTIYPHLSLGPGQRFASKGGYIVRFSDDHSEKLIAESGWIVP